MDKKLKIELWPIEQVIPYDLNAKIHDHEQVARIAKSIAQFGWDVPIVVDKHGVIIKGHGRRLAAMDLGQTHVPVLKRDDLTPEQVKAARLADNRVALSDVDPEKLRADLEGLDFDMTGIFDEKELEFLDADLGTVNDAAFVTDMSKTVNDQKDDLEMRIDRAEKAEITLQKAFGFKTVPGASQRTISRFMALAESHTASVGADALVKYMEEIVGERVPE